MQIVAVDDEVAAEIRRADGFVRMPHQRPVGHGQVVVVDVFLALKKKFRHRGGYLWESARHRRGQS